MYKRPFAAEISGDLYDAVTAPDGWVLVFDGADHSFLTDFFNGHVLFNELGTACVFTIDLGIRDHWIRFVFDVDLWTYSMDVIGVNHLANTLVTKTIAAVQADGGAWEATWLPAAIDETVHDSTSTLGDSSADPSTAYPIQYERTTVVNKSGTSVGIRAFEYVGSKLRAVLEVNYSSDQRTIVQSFSRPDGLLDQYDETADHGESHNSATQVITKNQKVYVFEEGEALITLTDSGDESQTWNLDSDLDYSGGLNSDPGNVTVQFGYTGTTGTINDRRFLDARDSMYLIDVTTKDSVPLTTVTWSAFEAAEDFLAPVLIPNNIVNFRRFHRGVVTDYSSDARFTAYATSEMQSAYNAWKFAMSEGAGGYYDSGGNRYDLPIPRTLRSVGVSNYRLIPDGTYTNDAWNVMAYAVSGATSGETFILMNTGGNCALSIKQFPYPYTELPDEEMNYSIPCGLLEVTGDLPTSGYPGAVLRPLGVITAKA